MQKRVMFVTCLACLLLAAAGSSLIAETTTIEELDANMTLERADTSGVAWFDPRQAPFRVTGFKWMDRDGVYRRLPLEPAWEIRKPVDSLANSTAGGQIHFQSNSSKVLVRVKLAAPSGMYHMPATGQSGFDLYTGTPEAMRFVRTARFASQADEYTVELFQGSEQLRNFTLNFPLYNGVTSVEVGVVAGAVVKPPPAFREPGCIVVYGTSITQGGCAARPGMAYSNILSRRMNMEFVNLGFSGNGRGEPALAHLINQIEKTRLIVLDYEANANESIRQTLGPFVAILRDKQKDVPILVVSKIRYAAQFHDEAQRDAARELAAFQRQLVEDRRAAGDDDIHFLDGATLLGDHADECTVDGVHPTDLGFLRMANSMEPVLRTILKLE